MEFNIGDIVKLKESEHMFGVNFEVTGVIHDQGRLFITGRYDDEFEVSFSDVSSQYVLKEIES
jgi:hypothetical protein